MSDNTQDTKHGYYTGDIHNQFIEEHYDPKNKGLIFRTLAILVVLTLVELFIPFSSISHNVLIIIFIALTIVKAYFIVAYFMHLKHEKYTLRYSVILPFMLILYLIMMALAEGNYIHFWDNVPF